MPAQLRRPGAAGGAHTTTATTSGCSTAPRSPTSGSTPSPGGPRRSTASSRPRSTRCVPAATTSHERVKDMSAGGVLGVRCASRRSPAFSGRLFAACRRQGPRARDRAGLQRLAHRRVVRARIPGASSRWRCRCCGIPSCAPPRCAGWRRRAATRSRSPRTPRTLGYPSFHDAHWDPLWQALRRRGHRAERPPRLVGQARGHRARRADRRDDHAAADEHLPGRGRPRLVAGPQGVPRHCKIALSEGGTGWIPYFLDRLDRTYDMHHVWTGQDFGDQLPVRRLPRALPHVLHRRSRRASQLRDDIGIDNICWEQRLPALRLVVAQRTRRARRRSRRVRRVPTPSVNKITHENAMRWYSLRPVRAPHARAVHGRRAARRGRRATTSAIRAMDKGRFAGTATMSLGELAGAGDCMRAAR